MGYKFKGVYYTNVSTSTQRDFFANYQFGTLNFKNVTRLDGPNGQKYPSKKAVIDEAVKEFPHFEVYREMKNKKPHNIYGKGDLCCHWGFHRMFRRLQSDLNDDECALYCHDDIHIRKMEYVWSELSATMPKFSIVQLFWWKMRGHLPLTDDRTLPRINHHFYEGINRCGDGAMLLTKDGCKQLQELSMKYCQWPIDMLVYHHHDELTDAFHVKNCWDWTGHYSGSISDRDSANTI